jgi:hypothetical protein
MAAKSGEIRETSLAALLRLFAFDAKKSTGYT